jgi:hypothetical protein
MRAIIRKGPMEGAVSRFSPFPPLGSQTMCSQNSYRKISALAMRRDRFYPRSPGRRHSQTPQTISAGYPEAFVTNASLNNAEMPIE